ncbi:MAG: hypothetical protein C4336_00685 [Armatimonadota bacterium]
MTNRKVNLWRTILALTATIAVCLPSLLWWTVLALVGGTATFAPVGARHGVAPDPITISGFFRSLSNKEIEVIG